MILGQLERRAATVPTSFGGASDASALGLAPGAREGPVREGQLTP